MSSDKNFVSAQMDTTLITALGQYATDNGITRSAAVRRAIEQLLAGADTP